MQALRVSEGVGRIRGRPVEGAGTETANLDFVGPDGWVNGIKVLIEDEAVLYCVSIEMARVVMVVRGWDGPRVLQLKLGHRSRCTQRYQYR